MESENLGDLNWQHYEIITKYIYETLGAQYGIKVIGYGKDCKVVGKSTVKHQVDVLTEQFSEGKLCRTAIECKFWNKKVTKEVVMKLHNVMSDCGIASGIIVCKKGYTKDTLVYAEHMGIKLVELRELNKDEAESKEEITLGFFDIHSQITIRRPHIICVDLGTIQIYDEREIMALNFSNYAIIHTVDGQFIPFNHYLKAYCDELHIRLQFLKTITISYPPVKGKLVRSVNNWSHEIEKISFTGLLLEIDASSTKSFQLVDQVWMILKEIFEKKAYKLTKNGILFEN